MKYTLTLLAFCLIGLSDFAQAPRTPVAVFRFVSGLPAEYRNRTLQIQSMVMETIRANPGIDLIDRSNDSLLMQELIMQMRETSVVANGLVAQGKVAGAKDMIVGSVSTVSVEEKRAPAGIGLGSQANAAVMYTAAVSFSLQLSNVETGVVMSQKSFSNKDRHGVLGIAHVELSPSAEGAIIKAINTCLKQVESWLTEAVPAEIRLLGIDSRDAHGLPTTMLVSGLGASTKKGCQLAINEIAMVDNGNGQMLRRARKLVDLRVSERQGDITVCRLTSGEAVIEERMKAGAKLECVIVK